MASIDELIPLVQAKVPQAPKVLIRAAALKVSRDFFRRTRSWKFTEKGALSTGDSEMPVTTAQGVEVAGITYLSINKREVNPLVEAPVDLIARQPSSAALGYDDGAATLYFNGEATKDTEYSVQVALMPSLSNPVVDTQMIQQWGELIADGASAELMEQPQKEWSDPNMSVHLRQKYNSAVLKQKNLQSSGYASGTQTVQPRRWI